MSRIISCPFTSESLQIPDVTITSIVCDALRQHSGVALVDEDRGVQVSGQDLLSRAEALARHLRERGFGSNDVIAIFSPNSVEWTVVALAAWCVDGTPAGINALLTQDELSYQMKLCSPKILYAEKSLSDVAVKAVKAIGLENSITIISNGDVPGCINLNTLLTTENSPASAVPETVGSRRSVYPVSTPAVILYSSGTTGLQKPVVLSHRNLVHLNFLSIHPTFELGFANVVLFAPMSHIAGFLLTIVALNRRGTVRITARFDFRKYVQLLCRHKIRHIFVVPPIATLLAKSPVVAELELELEELVCGAAPLGVEVEEQLRQRFPGISVRQSYGMTESTANSITVPANVGLARKPGSVGVPVFNTHIKVIDVVANKLLGPNEPGEICIKSPQVMLRYLGNQSATTDTIDKEGWLHTGDLGYYDSDGYFFIVDRIKELIKFNAYQVAPAELESVLLSHPEVADAAVIGRPEPSVGEVPMAFVVRKPKSTVSEVDIEDFVRGKVAPYKRLRGGVKFVEVIPKSASGKILRKDIKNSLLNNKL